MLITVSNEEPRRISLVLSGLFGVAIGLILVTQPMAMARSITWFYGFFILASGIAILSYHVFSDRRPSAAVQGFTGIVIGGLLMVYPDMAFNIAMIFIALWLLTIGLSQALQGMLLRKYAIGMIMFLSGIFCIGMAIMLLFFPAIPLLAIGYYIIIYGVVLIFAALPKKVT